jgi:hypothetical protein
VLFIICNTSSTNNFQEKKLSVLLNLDNVVNKLNNNGKKKLNDKLFNNQISSRRLISIMVSVKYFKKTNSQKQSQNFMDAHEYI